MFLASLYWANEFISISHVDYEARFCCWYWRHDTSRGLPMQSDRYNRTIKCFFLSLTWFVQCTNQTSFIRHQILFSYFIFSFRLPSISTIILDHSYLVGAPKQSSEKKKRNLEVFWSDPSIILETRPLFSLLQERKDRSWQISRMRSICRQNDINNHDQVLVTCEAIKILKGQTASSSSGGREQ